MASACWWSNEESCEIEVTMPETLSSTAEFTVGRTVNLVVFVILLLMKLSLTLPAMKESVGNEEKDEEKVKWRLLLG